MSTATLERSAPTVRPLTHGPLFLDVVKSEWTKLRSVRSSYWTLLGAFVATVGLSALICGVYASQYGHLSLVEKLHFDPTATSLGGVSLAQFAIGVLGVLVITGEYSTGAIRSTFASVPQRPLVLAAKATVFAGVALVVGLACTVVAFFTGQAILSSQGISASISGAGVLRAVVGAGVYLALLGLFALGIGTLIRRSAGAISTLFGIILVLPILVQALPASWSSGFAKYLPASAGAAISHTVQAAPHTAASLSPLTGLGVFALYAFGALAMAGVVMNRRDA